MKVLLVEDETLAADNLVKILRKIGGMDILAVLESVYETVEWFATHDQPDLVFMDIHLADGSAFEIFDSVDITCPIVFTTAYDEYALKAFKVNSIDYLLKPVESAAVEAALEKQRRLQPVDGDLTGKLRQLIARFQDEPIYKSSFLVPVKGDKLVPVKTEDILYFHIDHGVVKAVLEDGRQHILDMTLDELSKALDPRMFFRANRQFLLSRQAIRDMDLWFNQRLSVNLTVPAPEKIIISKTRITEFKNWFGS
ncbi:MAG: LytTR family DNA-binding domain-containing protein [Bacteroidales bacterium]